MIKKIKIINTINKELKLDQSDDYYLMVNMFILLNAGPIFQIASHRSNSTRYFLVMHYQIYNIYVFWTYIDKSLIMND